MLQSLASDGVLMLGNLKGYFWYLLLLQAIALGFFSMKHPARLRVPLNISESPFWGPLKRGPHLENYPHRSAQARLCGLRVFRGPQCPQTLLFFELPCQAVLSFDSRIIRLGKDVRDEWFAGSGLRALQGS